MRIHLLIPIFIFYSTLFIGQNTQKIDSLKNEISLPKTIEKTLETYSQLLYEEYIGNPKEMLPTIMELKEISEKKACGKCLGTALYWEGQYYFQNGNYKQAINSFLKCKRASEKANDSYTKNKALTYLSTSYYATNDYENAKKYANLLVENEKTKTSISNALIDGYFMLGMINDDQNYYSLAVQNYKKADSLNDIQNSEFSYDYKARIYNNLAILFLSIDDLEKAAYYLEETAAIYKQKKDSAGIFLAKENFGRLKIKQKKYKEAIKLLSQVEIYYQKRNFSNNLANVKHYLGKAYYQEGKYNKAVNKLEKSLTIYTSIGDSLKVADNYNSLGDCYFNIKNYSKATHNYTNALTIYRSLNILKGQIKVLSSLSKLEELLNKNKEALLFERNKDSLQILFQEKIKQKSIYETEAKYQNLQKQQKINLLQSQKKIAEQQKINQRILFISGIVLTTLASLFFFYLYQNRKKVAEKLKDLDRAKSNFFTNISHEFRTPLTLIYGPIQKKLKDPKLPKKERESLEMMQRNSNRLLSLVDQLLDISKLESGELHLSISENNLFNFIGILTESFSFSAKQKNINYLCYINKSESNTWYDNDVFEKIIINLLSNAIKYTPENGSIICNAFIKNNEFYFEVKNTGEGLTADETSKIFDKFYQINNHQQGAGIGLSLVKELVNLHKGTIKVKSTLKEWTVFKVVLPIDKNSYRESEILVSNLDKKEPFIIIPEESFNIEVENDENISKEDQPILLIVDDNKDIRDYIENIFKENYSIIKAKDGQEGTEIAFKHIPDIIISDIMMPIKNGIELCVQLKADERTSHIPILLLTAKAGDENELEGIKTGVDDYITKPFNEELLIVKIDNFIKSRKKLQERYSQEIILKPKEITVNSVDEKFLTKIQKVLDDNLIESSLNIEEFSKAIGMSRMQLHRKLKALTGLSASEFIRSQRLKLAAQLLKKSDINISQVGYAVGFNDHSYFTKCFKKAYKCTPTEYSKH